MTSSPTVKHSGAVNGAVNLAFLAFKKIYIHYNGTEKEFTSFLKNVYEKGERKVSFPFCIGEFNFSYF